MRWGPAGTENCRKATAKSIADLIEEGYQVAITHSNAPQVGMIHAAMNEFGKAHPDYTAAPMSVCSAMSQGYIGYDLQNGIREELLNPRHLSHSKYCVDAGHCGSL